MAFASRSRSEYADQQLILARCYHGSETKARFLSSMVRQVIPFDDDISARLKIRGNTRKELASSLNFARFWMPRLFPHLHGRVVYLDDDVLVLGDIREMRVCWPNALAGLAPRTRSHIGCLDTQPGCDF
jgi:hypothetical protein